MNSDIDYRTIRVGFFTLLAVMVIAGGCGRGKPGAESGHVKDDGCGQGAAAPALTSGEENGSEEHGEDDGHGHGASKVIALDELESVRCEHEMPTYQCAECRYEVGVVKVDAAALKREDGGGLVRTQAVVRSEAAALLQATGEVVLNDNTTVHISPRIAGIIESVPADIGARVKSGDVLLTLVSAELGRALADYERNRTLTALTEKIVAREIKLREEKVGSEQDLIEAQMTFEQHSAELKASEQMLHVLGLTVDDLAALRAQDQGVGAGRLSVRAPIAGTVIEKHAVAGEMAEAGKDLMLLADLTTVWVWADIQSRDLAQLLQAEKRGQVAVTIKVSAFPGQLFSGNIDYVGATMNEQTRTVKVRATVANADMELRPGMFCDVSIAIADGKGEEVLAVPRASLMEDEGKSFVFAHWKDDYFVRRDVRKGREMPDTIEVLEGLQAGETIVTDGAFLLKSDVLREKMGAGCAD